MSNNSVRKAAVLIGLGIALSGVSDANAATACTGDVATSKNPAWIVPVVILSNGIAGDECDVNDATKLLVTDPARSGSNTASSSDTSSSAQFDSSSGTDDGANFSPNFSLSGPLPQSFVVNSGGAAKSPGPSDTPVVTGSQGGQTTADSKGGSQGGQTTADSKAGSQGGQTTADSKGGSKSGQTAAGGKGASKSGQTAAGGKGGSKSGQTAAGGKGGSQGGQTTAGGNGSQGDGSGNSGVDPVLTSLTSLSVASTATPSGAGTDQGFTSVGDPAQAATPLPAALPLFAAGIGGLGLLGWRRKRKARAVSS